MDCKPESQHLKLTPLPILREIIAVVFTLSIVVFARGFILAQGPPVTPGPPEWVSDELLVGLRAGPSRGHAKAIFNSHGATEIEKIAKTNVHVIQVPPAARSCSWNRNKALRIIGIVIA